MDSLPPNEGAENGLVGLRQDLSTSSTKRRIAQLAALRERLVNHEYAPEEHLVILEYLCSTYPAYVDRPSRRAVQSTLESLLSQDTSGAVLAALSKFLNAESQKNVLAPASLFVLTEWSSIVLQHLTDSADQHRQDIALDVLVADARFLERCLSDHTRPSRSQAALVVTRRALRSLFKHPDHGPLDLEQAVSRLTAKSGSQPSFAVMLGVIAGVCSRSSLKPQLEPLATKFYEFYVREIVGSRNVLPAHIANGLADFFAGYCSEQALLQSIIPPLEKALLRAPEVVLNDMISPMVISLAANINLSEVLSKHLLKPLMANVKSSNPSIRTGALTVFRNIVTKCHQEASADGSRSMAHVVQELMKPLKDAKSSTPDQRVIYASMLGSVPPSKPALSIIPELAQVAMKETNESALAAESEALSQYSSYALNSDASLDSSVPKAFLHGLSDKKVNTRRIWAMRFGQIVIALNPEILRHASTQALFDPLCDKLVADFLDVQTNPIAAATNGLTAVANVFVSIALSQSKHLESSKLSALVKKHDIVRLVLGANNKPFYLFNHRIYSKLATDDDFFWNLRALEAVADVAFAPENDKTTSTTTEGWAHALIFQITSLSVPPKSRKHACNLLTRVYIQHPEPVIRAITSALMGWLQALALEEKDSPAQAAKSSADQLHAIVHAVCPPQEELQGTSALPSKSILERQMIELLVLCRKPLISHTSWIESCLRCNIDPKSLVTAYPDECMKQVTKYATDINNEFDRLIHRAACDTAAELAFIAPEVITVRIIHLIKSDLNTSQLKNIGPTEAAIFRTPDDTVFIDVLSQKAVEVPDKNAKDYDTLRWEQELREQLARKQGQQKKLSGEDQAKVRAQLEKEKGIRKNVAAVKAAVHRGASIIHSLATGPPSDVEAWLGPAVTALLGAMKADIGLILGQPAISAYLSCADLISPRLGTMRLFVGVATLRAYGLHGLSEDLLQEPLGELVTRILYRLRFSAEQRPFDVVSLNYILPLIMIVLESGGSGRSSGDEADEQITLALEFLSYHANQFSTANLPRQQILDLLVRTMQRYNQHYRILKDCLNGICNALAPDATDSEIAVLLRACIVPEESVRASALQAIDTELALHENTFYVEIWLAKCDDNERNAEMADDIWDENSLTLETAMSREIIHFLESTDRALRIAAAQALTSLIRKRRSEFDGVLETLQNLYLEAAKIRLPELDAYGMPKKVDLTDPWETRHGIAAAFKDLTGVFNMDKLVEFVRFMVEKGPLSDRSNAVRDEMIQATTLLIARRGSAKVEELMVVFENTLEAPDSGSSEHDKVNEAVIILYGALARHLKTGDERISKVINRLLVTLSTPSENVQYAIAGCLPPLVQNSSSETSQYVDHVMADLLQSKQYATRRGAAYGLAGIIQGRGISAFKEFRILSALKAAAEDKKDPKQRSGAFLAYEVLSLLLGIVFEPYVIRIVPQLLAGFGDSSVDVRDACLDAAKTCFSSLSSYGVKEILPTLLEGLEDDAWRSKKGACDSLGAMAYLDPQQLAVSLPEIIPPLTNVLNDSHKEVRASANRSLQRFGEVISNPEIKSLVNILLKALSDPTKYTDDALDALLKVSFVHYLDAPSLALVSRILERGLGDRSNTKRKASQIIGSLAHLTDRKDLTSHLPILVSGLRVAAVDPVPTTRATASKALGSLVEKLGEDALPDLIPNLMAALKTDTGAGDRLGSAQALSEVLAGLGTDRLEETLPSILQNVSSSKPAVREGFMSLFIFLPACFGNSFANYLSRIIPPILSGLADEVDSIRETSLRAGRLLVKNFATRAIDLLLPELQRGLSDYNHRIRLSSVELVGDLLFNLTGISAKVEEQGEEEEMATAAGQSLLEVLGEEKRNNILSALYISRCDTSGLVRNAAVNVWKALVATPKTLREITPTLTQMIIRRLASSNAEQKAIAGNALGELIRKAGDGVLASLVPTLEEGLQTSTDTDAKQGICLALRELIMSATAENLEDHEANISSVVRTALIDPNENVREAAAEAFDSLQRLFGKRVVDQILPHLLNLLREPDEADNALAALLTLLTDHSRSSMILPHLLPTLLTAPISSFNARALSSLAEVAGQSLARRLSTVLNALLDSIVTCKDDDERLQDLDAAFDAVLLSVDEFDGLNTAMSVMMALVKHDDHRKRSAADLHLANFFSATEVDYSRYYPDLIRVLLLSFDDADEEVVKAAWKALSTLTSKLRNEDKEALVIPTRQILRQVGVPGNNLRGFQLPKGINAILPIFLQGLINGSAEQRVQAALAILDIIERTGEDALKPFVTQITGPLIRVVSERSVDVKAAILLTLGHLLEKIPAALKPFLPQLQRTFTKSLADPSSELLRTRAAKALGILITLTARIDPLIAELVTGSKTTDPGVRNAMQKALYEVVSKAGANMNDASRSAIIGLIDNADASEDATLITNARLLGALVKNLPPDVAAPLVKSRVLPPHPTKSSMLSLNAVLLDSPATLLSIPLFTTETQASLARAIDSSDPGVSENGVLAAGKYLLNIAKDSEDTNNGHTFETAKTLFTALSTALPPGAALDPRRLALVTIRTVARLYPTLTRPHLALLAPPVFAGVRDTVVPIKLAAEAAFMALFCVVQEGETLFEKYLQAQSQDQAGSSALPPQTRRAMQDYFRRVAMRLAAQARERAQAEGSAGVLGLSADEVEDEREVWSVGRLEVEGENGA